MLTRVYAHNFRCFENLDFKVGDESSILLIGKNGAGKTSLFSVLKIFQTIGRGRNRVKELVDSTDFTRGRTDTPMRFRIEARLGTREFVYELALELPDRFRELRILEEHLAVDGAKLFSRELGQVSLFRNSQGFSDAARFAMDWHLVALPVIENPTTANALSEFRSWLARMVLISPIPALMAGEASSGTSELSDSADNWADWLSGMLDRFPAAYTTVSDYLKITMPDLADFRFERIGKEAKSLVVRFKSRASQFELPVAKLSDGEKCFFLCAVVLAANEFSEYMLTYWDEPDSHLAMDEVSQFVLALRRASGHGKQIVLSSHDPEVLRRFSNENTWILGRRGHTEPTVIRKLSEVSHSGDVVSHLIREGFDLWE